MICLFGDLDIHPLNLLIRERDCQFIAFLLREECRDARIIIHRQVPVFSIYGKFMYRTGNLFGFFIFHILVYSCCQHIITALGY